MSQLQQLLTRCVSSINATHLDPEEWAPALCQTTIELDPEEPIPLDEDSFCSYLDHLDPQWQLLDTSDE
jgi:hypothetical protein